MVVFLLLLIVAILLFGAATVRGAIAKILAGLAVLLIIAVAIVLTSPFLGDDGLVWIGLGVMGLLAIWGFIQQSKAADHQASYRAFSAIPAPARPAARQTTRAESIWERFEPHLAGCLEPIDRKTIEMLIRADNAERLTAFCQKLIRREYAADAPRIIAMCSGHC